MAKVKFRTAYTPVPRVQLVCEDESLADQDQFQDSDLNVMVKRFGVVPPSAFVPRRALDEFVTSGEFRDALDLVKSGQSAFDEMSSEVRKRFDNDPYQLLEFLEDEANMPEAVKLGLVEAPPPPVDPPPKE